MARFLGIDYGLERTGLAVSDPSGRLVFPLATCSLAQHGTRSALLDAIARLAAAENIDKVVLGLPLFSDGSENMMCRQVRNIAKRLKRRISRPMYFMPEFLSSDEAMADLRHAGVKSARIAAVLDQQAACRILESFLAQPEGQWISA